MSHFDSSGDVQLRTSSFDTPKSSTDRLRGQEGCRPGLDEVDFLAETNWQQLWHNERAT